MTPSRWLRIRSRLDRCAGIVGALIASPVVFVLALVARATDPGPGLIRVPRVGAGGQVFGLWKIRTMHVGPLTTTSDGPSLVAGADPRLTPMGRRMRRSRVDELPQLFNVATGQMTLIGPRPEASEFVDLGDPKWNVPLLVPPGIAGPTQVLVERWEAELLAAAHDPEATYRETILPIKLAIDAWYVEHATPRVDLMIAVSLVQRTFLDRRRSVLDRYVADRVPEASVILAPRH